MYSRISPGSDEFFVATDGISNREEYPDPHHINLRDRPAPDVAGQNTGYTTAPGSILSGLFGGAGGLLERLGLKDIEIGDLILLLILFLLFLEDGENDFLIIVAIFIVLKL